MRDSKTQRVVRIGLRTQILGKEEQAMGGGMPKAAYGAQQAKAGARTAARIGMSNSPREAT